MSVKTGFGGQPFIPEVLDKVRAARARDRRAAVCACEIEIDGGIKIDNAHLAAEAGVDILVSGTGIFGADDPLAAAAAIRDAASRPRALNRGAAGKVLTVSDGVVAGTRDDKSGRRARATGSPTRGLRRRRPPRRRRRHRQRGRRVPRADRRVRGAGSSRRAVPGSVRAT